MKKIIAIIILCLSVIIGSMPVFAETNNYEKVFAIPYCTIAITRDGEVKAVGYDAEKIENKFAGTTPIVDIFSNSILGVTSEGKVFSVYFVWDDEALNEYGPYKSLSDGKYYAVGLKEDGKVIAISNYMNDKKYIFPWDDIVDLTDLQVSNHAMVCALKKDGTIVIAREQNKSYVFDDGPAVFKDICKIDAGYDVLAGLKSDGTVIAYNYMFNTEKILDWKDIVDIAVSADAVYALKVDGTVCCYDINMDREINMSAISGWNSIISISASDTHIVALREDGKVLAKGNNEKGQCDVNGWDLSPLKGDANDDNVVNAEDALAVLKVAAKIEVYGKEFVPGKWSPENAKVTNNGVDNITANDALEILKIAANIR